MKDLQPTYSKPCDTSQKLDRLIKQGRLVFTMGAIIEVAGPLLSKVAQSEKKGLRYGSIVQGLTPDDMEAVILNSHESHWEKRPLFFVLLIREFMQLRQSSLTSMP